MTRNEALKKIENVIVNSSGLLDALEALELIKFDKFDEEKEWWKSSAGHYCEFSQGFDPNTVSGIYWWKVKSCR